MAPILKPVIIRCREKLREGRERVRGIHERGAPGVQVCNLLADLFDDIVLEVWEEALTGFPESQAASHPASERRSDSGSNAGSERAGSGPAATDALGPGTLGPGTLGPGTTSLEGGGSGELADSRWKSRLALVAHGGFGRRDVSPYSDLDLMLLTSRGAGRVADHLARHLSRDLVDIGFHVGFSIRTPAEACGLAWRDPVIFSSLAESRLVAGSLHVYRHYFESLRKGAKRRRGQLIGPLVAARREERRKWGETNYLLRPNVKRSQGGLRDIQLIRWVGFTRLGETELEQLVKLGALPEEDYQRLRRAYGFLLRLRHELHFRGGREQDVLDRPTQLEIAAAWGYRGSTGLLPVEQFMQDYFEHTQDVRYASAFFADDSRDRSVVARAIEAVFSRRIDDQIRMGPTHIWVEERALETFAGDLTNVLRLMHLANHHRRRILHPTWQAIRQAMLEREPRHPDAESISYFLGLLSRPGRLAPLLRRLHELRVLEQLIPAMKRCRGLLQFNAYHKFTVDAHCIRAVEMATDLESEPSPMGRRYRRLKDKTILHLALLIHDLGKGFDEDHCEVGRRIAQQTAEHLQLDPASAETLQWLIHRHLMVNVYAFRHDLTDPQVVLGFAAEVASVRRLELLIVHAVADLAAVGPGVATDWKMHLIEELYLRTRRYFETGDLPGESEEEIEALREPVREALGVAGADQDGYRLLDSLPLSVLRSGAASELARQLVEIVQWQRGGTRSHCVSQFDAQLSAMRYTVLHHEGSQRIGTFARATGALSGCGLAIMRANIETVGEDLVWDDFWVVDPDYPGEPPPSRTAEVCRRVVSLLDAPQMPLPDQRRVWPSDRVREPASVNVLPTKVTFDNETLDRYTIVSLFAYDRVGLLYRVATALAGHELILHFAKIDTHLDQIADVFYITDRDGGRIVDEERQQRIREAILQAAA